MTLEEHIRRFMLKVVGESLKEKEDALALHNMYLLYSIFIIIIITISTITVTIIIIILK